MSKEMKDFLSQFMNQPETKTERVVEKNPVEKKETKPKTVKNTKPKADISPMPQPKALENKDVADTTIISAMPKSKTLKANFTEGVSAEVFLQSINDKNFSFNKKKNLQIDDQLFNILNLLKQHEGIKSIATLLNAIIEKYIDDNKVELKRILSKNPLT